MTESLHKESIVRHRQIRSFVRREGRITPSQQLALDSLSPKYGIEYGDSIVDLNNIFNRKAQVSIDIGFGNGVSMLEIATNQSDWNHLGIEVHRPGMGRLFSQLEERKLSNVRAICADAVEVLTNMIADASIDRFLIFFPDPWPKKRHHKRRLIQQEFTQLMAKKLKSNGVVHLATDWQPYAQWMLEVMDDDSQYSNLAGEGNYSEKPNYRPTTKFETRGQKLGHGVFDLIYKRL